MQPRIPVELTEIDGVTRPLGKLLQVLELRPAIPLPERVDVIHIPHNFPGPRRELCRGQVIEKVGCSDLAMYVSHAGLDISPELELLPALGNLHGADFSCPFIDILKQVPMDRLQVGEIEIPSRDASLCPLHHKATFDTIEIGCQPDPEFIPEDRCSWINVRIVAHSAATGTCSPFACATM
jgi:hypothetical protein